jgi:hypothetical protein
LVQLRAEEFDKMRDWARSPSNLKAINSRNCAYEKVADEVFGVEPNKFNADTYAFLGLKYKKGAHE